MNRKDWTTLDILLQKEGFGGYYDLIESIKDNTKRITTNPSITKQINRCKTIKQAIELQRYAITHME